MMVMGHIEWVELLVSFDKEALRPLAFIFTMGSISARKPPQMCGRYKAEKSCLLA